MRPVGSVSLCEIAKQGAAARWGGRVYTASHKGNFLDDFGLDIECYVLDDAAKTPVISQRGMGEAIGFSRRGSRLTVFVNSQTMDGYLGRDLREKIQNPLVFQTFGAAALTGSSAASSCSSPVAIRITFTALPITSAGRFSPRGPLGIAPLHAYR